MFDNIGGKLKSLAVIIFIIEAIGALALGIVLLAMDTLETPLLPILIMVFGIVGSWVTSWLLYGFGELIEKTTEVAWNTRKAPDAPTPYTETPVFAANNAPAQPTPARSVPAPAPVQPERKQSIATPTYKLFEAAPAKTNCCPHCGTVHNAEAKFCIKCGSLL